MLFLIIIPFSFSMEVKLKDFDFSLNDVSQMGLNSDEIFEGMDRDFIKLKGSICSNRAHMWANDLKNDHKIDSAKIFMFYTARSEQDSRSMWWYHVAPVINERGFLWVLDAGFPHALQRPVTIPEWLESFSRSLNCKEIKRNEKDLAKLIYDVRAFPKATSYGKFDCYFIISPSSYWTPRQIAMNFLKEDEEGNRLNFERASIDPDDLFQACLEATSSKLEYVLGTHTKKCREYLQKSKPN